MNRLQDFYVSGDLANSFQESTVPTQPKKKRPAPISVRLSAAERAEVEAAADGVSLNAYIRSCILTDQAVKRATRKSNNKRDKALARAIRRLGHAGLSTFLMSQIVAKEEGRIFLSETEEADLRFAYKELYCIRKDLMEAIGLNVEQ